MHDVKLYLTNGVIEGLARQAAEGDDLCITGYDGQGGIFFESASTVGEPGSGVWMDAVGTVHYSPPADRTEFAIDGDAREFHQPKLKTYTASAHVTVSSTLHEQAVHDAVGEALERGLRDIDSKEGPMHEVQVNDIIVEEQERTTA
jgi:hypothetical protein